MKKTHKDKDIDWQKKTRIYFLLATKYNSPARYGCWAILPFSNRVLSRAATSSAFSRKILLFEDFSAFLILCFLYLQPIFLYLKDHFQKYTDKFLSILADAFVFLWFFYKESSYFPLAAKNYQYIFFVFIPYLTYIFLSAIYSVVHLIYTNVLIF